MLNWFNKLKLGTKISLGFSIIVFILIINGILNYFYMAEFERINVSRNSATELINAVDKTFTDYLKKMYLHRCMYNNHSTKPLFVKSGSGFFRLLAKVGGYGMKMQLVKMEWRF